MTPTSYNPAAWDWGYLAGQAATFGLKLLGAIIIFAVGYFLAGLVSRLLDRLLLRIGFDGIMERGGIRQTMMESGYDPARLVSKGIFYTLMIFVIAFALSVFGPNPVSDMFSRFIAFFPNILVALVMVIAAFAIGSIVRDLIRAAIGGLSYGRTISTVAYVGILMLGAFMALTQLNIAPQIIVGLWYAMLALVVGVGVVAIGGGGIKPMEERWRRTLDKADQEVPRVVNQINNVAETAQMSNANMSTDQSGVVYPVQNPNDLRGRR